MQNGISAFMSTPSIKLSTNLNAKKQSRSSLLEIKNDAKPSRSTIQTPTESDKEEEEVFDNASDACESVKSNKREA